MPKMKKNFDNLMKNFIPAETDTEQSVATSPPTKVLDNSITDPSEGVEEFETIKSHTEKKPVKEKQIPITFNIPSSLNDRLMRFVYERKISGMKITKTDVISSAIENYLNSLEN